MKQHFYIIKLIIKPTFPLTPIIKQTGMLRAGLLVLVFLSWPCKGHIRLNF